MHKIDLNKNTRIDLINDINIKSKSKKIVKKNVTIERVILNENNKYNKNKGEYISILFDDSTDKDNKNNIVDVLTSEINRLLKRKKLLNKSLLVVGLGNIYSTPDSLGPKTVENIISTRHIYLTSALDKKYSVVSKISPGVFAETGIESFDIIKGITDRIKPNYLIVIDALSTKTLNKVNKLIQITDSGIDPGSGVGNQRKEISKNTLGIEVISIGVPTVVNLHTIIKDSLNEYDLDNILDKLNDYLVTPKEIDFVIEELSFIISKSINNALHNMTK